MISCINNGSDISPLTFEEKKIAIELFTHSTIIDQVEYLEVGLHDKYLHPDIIARLENDAFMCKRLNTSIKVPCDTIFSYDEIPTVKESKFYTCIFEDGTWQSTTHHLTPFETNIIFQLNENTPEEERRIERTVVVDGHLRVYDTLGKLIDDELYPVTNMREFLDTMKNYVHVSKISKQKNTTDIAKIIYGIKKLLPEDNNVFRLPNGHVTIENCLLESTTEIKNISSPLTILKSRTELNEDMTKILKYELFQGDYLVERKTYTYCHNTALQNYHYNDMINENPETIESECLTLNANGFPVLHHTKEYFQRNQIYYYFKD